MRIIKRTYLWFSMGLAVLQTGGAWAGETVEISVDYSAYVRDTDGADLPDSITVCDDPELLENMRQMSSSRQNGHLYSYYFEAEGLEEDSDLYMAAPILGIREELDEQSIPAAEGVYEYLTIKNIRILDLEDMPYRKHNSDEEGPSCVVILDADADRHMYPKTIRLTMYQDNQLAGSYAGSTGYTTEWNTEDGVNITGFSSEFILPMSAEEAEEALEEAEIIYRNIYKWYVADDLMIDAGRHHVHVLGKKQNSKEMNNDDTSEEAIEGMSEDASEYLSIIGGADGPTSIFLAGKLP